MPGETPEQQAEKAAVMEGALKDACVVPLKIMRCCGGVIDLQKVMAEKGSALAKSDAGAGAVCAKAALQAASLNVFINAKAMVNRAHAEKVVRDARQLLEKYCPLADGVFSRVRETIS